MALDGPAGIATSTSSSAPRSLPSLGPRGDVEPGGRDGAPGLCDLTPVATEPGSRIGTPGLCELTPGPCSAA
eukprot:1558652-Pyramimonas_sp.AAC.1